MPGEPSGRITTRRIFPSHLLKPVAWSNRPNRGCIVEVTRTSHGNTCRNCCSLSVSRREQERPIFRRGYRVAFASAQDWVGRLAAAKKAGKLEEELERLRRVPLLIVDEVGYIPFDPDAAALFFALIASRYERASLIVSSNKTFSSWAEIFGDAVAVAALVDRLVHHAEVIVLQGDSYRLKDRTKEVVSTTEGV